MAIVNSPREHPWHERFSAPVPGESGICRVYFAVDSTADEPFDPDHITEEVGLKPYLAFRVGDLSEESSAPYRYSSWALAAPGRRGRPLEQQVRALYDLLRDSKPLKHWTHAHTSRLRFDLNIGRTPLTVRIPPPFVTLLDDFGSEIESNTLWWRERAVVDGACLHCGIVVPAQLEDIRRFVGGWRKAAMCRASLAYSDVELGDVPIAGFAPEPGSQSVQDLAHRLGDDLWVYYFPALRVLQFASSHQCAPEPELVVERFLAEVAPYVARLSMTSRAIVDVDVKDYGDVRGATSGLRMSRTTVKAIAALNAGFAMHLRFGTDPWFDIDGVCGNCSLDVLEQPEN